MKNTNDEDAIAKALQERYARILGVDETLAPTGVPKKSPRRYVWIFMITLVILAGAFGVWYFLRPPALIPTDVADTAAETGSQQPQPGPAHSEPLQKTEAGQSETLISEQAVARASEGESAAPAEGLDLARMYKQQLSKSRPSSNGEMKPKPAVPGASLVVLLSTTSKEEAIERAKELINSGNPSEVILSASGYYGVVLRHETYEQAQAAIKGLVASGVAKTAPYIMASDRVKERVYPEIR